MYKCPGDDGFDKLKATYDDPLAVVAPEADKPSRCVLGRRTFLYGDEVRFADSEDVDECEVKICNCYNPPHLLCRKGCSRN